MKYSLAILCALALAAPFSAMAGQELVVKELKQKYSRAKTEMDRLKVCIEAINKKVICEGCKVQDLDAVFATSYSKMDKSRLGLDSLYRGAVHFNPVDLSKSNRETGTASSYRGWFLGFQYTPDGRIYKYYLTNLSKLSL